MSPTRRIRLLSDFIALYRGRTVAEAELVAVTAEPRLVRRFFSELLGTPEEERATETSDHKSPTILEVVRDE